MVHHPEGDLGNSCRELAQLDAIELVHIELAHLRHVERKLAVFAEGFQQVDFEEAQLAVGDDQKVSATARRVKETERCELSVEGFDRLAAPAVATLRQTLELIAQIVEE